ncbi:UDP-N-acetylmuramoyl-tripeptide--D-alanyl-D-alanine ligase, partial [Patescibacteria group bacterium]|nr:UDP-N-acetylmuramoyl-tripeptide--D-alanyl-D-alanine ligase [Patescibacteria group bacterium]
MDTKTLHEKFLECKQEIATDTRTMTPGCIFFAWKGEFHDGNTFADEAIEKGARYVVIDNPHFAKDERYLVVDDGMKALARLATYHRRQFNVPVIAIGGSNGKTTSKELVARVLGTQKDVVASLGSENNHVGVPKTLLRMTRHTDIVVVEMGANHLGEIADLCRIAEPTHGIITNIGRDHIGFFGGPGAILEANLELYDYLRAHNGQVFVDVGDVLLSKYLEGLSHTSYGEGIGGEFGVNLISGSPTLSFEWNKETITTHLAGAYNLQNVAAAIVIGRTFDIIPAHIVQAIVSYQPTNNRSQLIESEKGNLIIKDFYNANRTSMERALDNLRELATKHPDKESIAILGDMLELGEYSMGEHQAAVDYAQELGIHHIVLIGTEFQKTRHGESFFYINVDEAIAELQQSPIKNSVIL